MVIKFLGTGASEGIPSPFCRCSVCMNARKYGGKYVRSRAGVLVDGRLLIDFSPDAFYQAYLNEINYDEVNTILFTHSHEDHLNPTDLCTAIHTKSYTNKLEIFGNAAVKSCIDEYARKYSVKIDNKMTYHVVGGGSVFTTDGYTVRGFSSVHMDGEDSLIYAVEKDGKTYFNCFDTDIPKGEVFDDMAAKGLKFDVIAFDLTYGIIENDWRRHMDVFKVERVIEELKRRNLVKHETEYYATHIYHGAGDNDEIEKACNAIGVKVAYDGLEINV